jgi:hypothetical protein
MKLLIAIILALAPSASFSLECQKGVYQGTVREVAAAEEKFKLPTKTWLGFASGNDEHDPLHRARRRSTLVVHHEVTSADLHYVIVWSHGVGGYHKFSSNMYPQLKELVRRGKSFTLIEPEMPWSCNVSRIDGRKSWLKPGSFKLLVESALQHARLKTKKNVLLVVGGHSRGGKSIKDSLVRGGLCDMNPQWIIWSDASYGDWLDKAWGTCLRNIPERVEIMCIKGTETCASARGLSSKDQHFDFVHMKVLGLPWYHGKVGDNALLISEFLK